MATTIKHQRQSNTRLDVLSLSMMLATPPQSTIHEHVSPRDSLPPLEDLYHPSFYHYSLGGTKQQTQVRSITAAATGNSVARKTGRQAAATTNARSKQQPPHEVAMQVTTAAPSAQQPSPKPHRPSPLVLSSSFGSTGLNSADLKQRICDASPASSATITQVTFDERQPLPPTPTSPFTMGNKPSSLPGDHVAEDKSVRSVVRRDSRQPISRKSSFNIFKRVDSKSPLPRDVTASVMSILHRDGGHKKQESSTTDDDGLVSVQTDPYLDHPDNYNGGYPDVHDMRPALHSASTVTMTDERAGLPLSATTTIRDCRSPDQSPVQLAQTDGAADLKSLPPLPPADDEALSPLSPTIPAPSPLPEDSPHKYGLRDKMDTPEVPETAPEEINVAKMRRKSSGLEIFNEAKSLQSAQSFLNGLSTSRRRAESAAAVRTTDNSESAKTAGSNSKPGRPASTNPSSSQLPSLPRQRGHNFKSSGFAYSRPLILAQIKCYRGHGRLVLSRNKHAPVECAVCHIDDDGDHFSCSWCALRMCRYCRADFAARGIGALRERIRKAELGGAVDSAESSSGEESTHELRKTRSSNFT